MVLSFSEAAAQAVQGAACSLLALSDEGTRWINSVIGADGDFGNVAGALRKNVCNESAPTGNYGPTLPFSGGQCSGVEYQITLKIEADEEDCDGGGFESKSPKEDQLTLFGPLSAPFIQVDTPSDCGDRTIRGAINGFESDGTPATRVTQSITTGRPDEKLINQVLTVTAGPTRVDGQPDDCGDPEGNPIGDYNDYSETVSITYEDNSQTEITEDIDITLGPLIVGIGGILYAPVTIGTGDISFNGEVKLAPEFSVDIWPDGLFGGGGNTDDPAPNPSEPDPEPTTPDDRRRIIGAIVTVTNFNEAISRVTQVAQDDSPDIFVPRTGNISFYIDTPGGQAWTEPTPLRNVRQYVPCPAREGAVDVAVTEGTGFTLAVTPVYADLAVI
jgi:hypothetical protein